MKQNTEFFWNFHQRNEAMTQDEIIEMAQECNLIGMRPHLDGIYSEALVAFAHLVAAKALAQQEQEPPVAFEYDEDNDPIGEVVGFIEGSNYIMVKVYDGKQVSLNDDLYATPPQRTWQGLTDEEISEVLGSDIHDEPSGELRFIRAIEAKLKEKNT